LTILERLDLEIQAGEAVAILGASGSGKSTLLGLLAGLDSATSGEVWLCGERVDDLDEDGRAALRSGRVGFVFQNFQLLPTLTARENVLLPLELTGTRDAARRADEALDRVGLTPRARHYPRQLSGGEQQRVALARALAPSPNLLMLDEPLGALDHTLRTQLIQELRAILHQSQIPVIYVTHDREEAFGLADRLVILHDGIILQQGSPQELFEQPESPWVAEFLGLGNLVPGVVTQAEPLMIKTKFAELTLPSQPILYHPGQECQILLRPEDALITPTILNGENQFECIVRDSLFMGEYYQLELLCGETTLFARSQAPANIGAKLEVSWPADKIRGFTDS
jgi:putative ABC transport system ATP-binding protein